MCLSVVADSVTPWTVALQAPVHGILQERILCGLPFPSPGDLPDPEIKPVSLRLGGGFFTTEPPGKPPDFLKCEIKAALGK